MVKGADRSGSRKRKFVRVTKGTRERYQEKSVGKPICITGRRLPGVAHGKPSQINKLAKTKRRPSRPFGGVLSSPALRSLIRQNVNPEGEPMQGDIFGVGRLCVKLAGRDAGKLCVVIKQDKDKVLVDGQTRRRAVNPAHLEPLNEVVKIKADAPTSEVVKALKAADIHIPESKPQSSFSKKPAPKKKAKQKK